MPRVLNKDNRTRQRCANACDNCKRKKERCDGGDPCGRCGLRKLLCRYSSVPASKLSSREEGSSTKAPVGESEEQPPTSEAPVPRAARLLTNSRGKYNYIGDSASLSFLQSACLLVSSTLGDCHFTSPELQRSIAEELPRTYSASLQVSSPSDWHYPSPDRAEYLVNEYLTATGCLLDLFDRDELIATSREMSVHGNSSSGIHRSAVFLVLSIGAQMDRNNAHDDEAGYYFKTGRELSYSILAEEPTVLTVQCFSLITMYLIGAYRANTAFMNLGIAIRGAYTLGLHREDMESFPKDEKLARGRAWITIRVLDIFLSASTGRPPATSYSDSERDSLTCEHSFNEPEALDPSDKFTWAVFRLCAIGERILVEVYKKRSVSTWLVDRICRDYRSWTQNLPDLPTSLRNEPQTEMHQGMARVIASAHLVGAYYWSIILLTRPFLLFHVSMRHQSHALFETLRSSTGSALSISKIADACVNAAIKGLDVILDVLGHENLPRRLPVILNSILNSALTIGVAFFGDYDQNFPLAANFERAQNALVKLADSDPQAQQFLSVVQAFSQAIKDYVNRRDQKNMQRKSDQVKETFGSVNSRFACPTASPSSKKTAPPLEEECLIPIETVGDSIGIDPNWYCEEVNHSRPIDAFATLTPLGLYLSRPGTSHGARIPHVGPSEVSGAATDIWDDSLNFGSSDFLETVDVATLLGTL